MILKGMGPWSVDHGREPCRLIFAQGLQSFKLHVSRLQRRHADRAGSGRARSPSRAVLLRKDPWPRQEFRARRRYWGMRRSGTENTVKPNRGASSLRLTTFQLKYTSIGRQVRGIKCVRVLSHNRTFCLCPTCSAPLKARDGVTMSMNA